MTRTVQPEPAQTAPSFLEGVRGFLGLGGVLAVAAVATALWLAADLPAHAQESESVDAAADSRECLNNAVDRQHSVYFRKPLNMRRARTANFRVSDWRVKLSGTRPDVLTACDLYGGRTIDTWISMRRVGSHQAKRVSTLATVVRDSNRDVHTRVALELKPHRFRDCVAGAVYRWFVNVREIGEYSGIVKRATTKTARGSARC